MSIPTFAPSAVTSIVAGRNSANVVLPTGSPTVLIVNLGVSVAYVLLGSAVVVSQSTGIALLPGASIALTIGSSTTLAAISDQDVPLNIAVGD